jgi:hypothetical protein
VTGFAALGLGDRRSVFRAIFVLTGNSPVADRRPLADQIAGGFWSPQDPTTACLRRDKAGRSAIRFAGRLARRASPVRRTVGCSRRSAAEGQAKGLGETMNAIANLENEVERISAWQCIGCGRIEGPQPCVGVCQDKKVTFVSAEASDAALTRMRQAEAQLAALESLANRMALAKPRQGEWERSYRALQDEARRALRQSRAAKVS